MSKTVGGAIPGLGIYPQDVIKLRAKIYPQPTVGTKKNRQQLKPPKQEKSQYITYNEMLDSNSQCFRRIFIDIETHAQRKC